MKSIANLTLAAALTVSAAPSQAQVLLTGDVRLACEAVLCLATAARPAACAASIARYFSINFKKPWETVRERINFLNLCPASSSSPQMASLITAMGSGAGSCDATSLNTSLRIGYLGNAGSSYISDQLPEYCAIYTQSAYTDGSLAVRYVGTTSRGGFWIEASKWQAAQAEWQAKVEAEDKAELSVSKDPFRVRF